MRTLRVIGPGRAGGAISIALESVGWTVAEPVRRGDRVDDAAMSVDLLIIATPDAVVAELACAIEPVATTVVAHLAGSLGLDVLAGHPRIAALHPLVSMPSAEVGASRLLNGAWFAVAGDPIVGEAVDDLGGHKFTVADAQRGLYHAAACVASNHLVALLGQVERMAGLAGIPIEAFTSLVEGTVANVGELGVAGALTGPAARGDDATLDRHRTAMSEAGVSHVDQDAYEAMVVLARLLADRLDPEHEPEP